MTKNELNKAIAEFFGYKVIGSLMVKRKLTANKLYATLKPPPPMPDFISEIAHERFTPKAAAYWLERDGK